MPPSTLSSPSHSPPPYHSPTPPIADETTALLPHERGPALESQQRTRSPPATPPTPEQPDNQHIPERVAELEHILSRIDTIEVGLWQDRLAQGGPLATDPHADAGDGQRLSRVSTYVGRVASRQKSGVARSSVGGAGEAAHRYFWADVAGVSSLGLLVAGMLLYVGFRLLGRGEGRWCGGGDGDVLCFICVQVLVSMAFGLLTEIPNRWVVPFVLPLWVVGVLGTMMAIQVLTCKA